MFAVILWLFVLDYICNICCIISVLVTYGCPSFKVFFLILGTWWISNDSGSHGNCVVCVWWFCGLYQFNTGEYFMCKSQGYDVDALGDHTQSSFCKHMHTHACAHAHTRTHTKHTHTHVRTHIHTRTHMHAHRHCKHIWKFYTPKYSCTHTAMYLHTAYAYLAVMLSFMVFKGL